METNYSTFYGNLPVVVMHFFIKRRIRSSSSQRYVISPLVNYRFNRIDIFSNS